MSIKKVATIYDVAKRADVSLATVSRVINNIDKVSKATKVKVETAIKELNYNPNAIAKGLATSKSTNVAIVLPAINVVHISNLLAGLVDVAKIYGYNCSIFTTTNDIDDAKTTIKKVISSRVDGVVLFNDQLDDEDLNKIIGFNMPVVVLGANLQNKKIASISFKYQDELKKLIKNKLAKSNNFIYYLNIEDSSKLNQEMIDAISSAHLEAKRTFAGDIPISDSYRKTYSLMVDWFKTNREGFYIAPRDSIAISVLNAAIDSGLRVPEDIEIMAVIGTKYSELSRPKLSSFSVDMYQLGCLGMRVLTKIIKDESYHSKELDLNCEFIDRGTTIA